MNNDKEILTGMLGIVGGINVIHNEHMQARTIQVSSDLYKLLQKLPDKNGDIWPECIQYHPLNNITFRHLWNDKQFYEPTKNESSGYLESGWSFDTTFGTIDTIFGTMRGMVGVVAFPDSLEPTPAEQWKKLKHKYSFWRKYADLGRTVRMFVEKILYYVR